MKVEDIRNRMSPFANLIELIENKIVNKQLIPDELILENIEQCKKEMSVLCNKSCSTPCGDNYCEEYGCVKNKSSELQENNLLLNPLELKQTPVEWLEIQIKNYTIDLDLFNDVERAKEMEKNLYKDIINRISQRIIDSARGYGDTIRTGDYRIGLTKAMEIINAKLNK